MNKEKKKWETPKLICLYRGRPEEAVLVYCKTNKGGGVNTTKNCSGTAQCLEVQAS